MHAMGSHSNHDAGVFTAVPVKCTAENSTQTPSDDTIPELRAPLLGVESLKASTPCAVDCGYGCGAGDDDDESLNDEEDVHILSCIMTKFRLWGLVLGLIVQLLNVGGTTYLFLRWGKRGTSLPTVLEGNDSLLHMIVLILTQADLYLYVFMWVCLTALLTKPGMRLARRKFFSNVTMQPSKRSIFVMGVNFYVGVVVGVFLAWTAIDAFLGLPVPVMPMVGVLLFGLVISYAMIWCYDMEEVEEAR